MHVTSSFFPWCAATPEEQYVNQRVLMDIIHLVARNTLDHKVALKRLPKARLHCVLRMPLHLSSWFVGRNVH